MKEADNLSNLKNPLLYAAANQTFGQIGGLFEMDLHKTSKRAAVTAICVQSTLIVRKPHGRIQSAAFKGAVKHAEHKQCTAHDRQTIVCF